MMAANLLYRFPSSQSSSSSQPARHSWPTYRYTQHPQSPVENWPTAIDRKVSASSFDSLASTSNGPLRVRNENIPPNRSGSYSLYLSAQDTIDNTTQKVESKALDRPNQGSNKTTSRDIEITDSLPQGEECYDIDLSARCGQDDQSLGGYASSTQPRLSFDVAKKDVLSVSHQRPHVYKGAKLESPSIMVTDTTNHPLKRLMNSVRHKKSTPKRPLKIREERWSLDDVENLPPADEPTRSRSKLNRHSKSSSWSSAGIASAAKSATASLTISQPKLTGEVRKKNRSSLFGKSKRRSAEGGPAATAVINEDAWIRSRQRRSTLEEIISSEQSYIADLKVLINVYLAFLESTCSTPQRIWADITRNVHEILKLHEDILMHMRRILPWTYQAYAMERGDVRPREGPRKSDIQHLRGTSKAQTTELGAHGYLKSSQDDQATASGLLAEPQEAADVARIFDRLMPRFFIYEEYGARYESMLHHMTATFKHIPTWNAYERSIEALALTLAPSSGSDVGNRKGLTCEDLLIKPIQRVCKYPLLFADLYKYTSNSDDTDARKEIEKVLSRLRETTQDINNSTNDQEARDRIQRSWNLQDLLAIPDVPTAPPSLRLLGHALLCGVLYAAYQTTDGLHGGFKLCTMFRSYFLIACPKSETSEYHVEALIHLANVRIEESDNGRGLQCHTAPYSWKMVFESEHFLYEIMLCACSRREEEQWRKYLWEHASKEMQRQHEDDSISPLTYAILETDMKSFGQVFHRTNPLDRCLSIQRAATIPGNSVCHVFIRNTSAKDHRQRDISPTDSVVRSQSLLSYNRIPLLSPNRTERIRMEHQLTKVWTRELIPYPGMVGPRGDNSIRSSATSMIRKFSLASISSSFSKRSTSVSSLAESRQEGPVDRPKRQNDRKPGRRPRLHASKSMDLGLRSRQRATKDSPNAKVVRRSNSLAGKTFRSKSKHLNKNKSESEAVAPIQSRHSSGDSSTETVKVKPSTATGLFAALSAEGIRTWLQPSR